MALMDAGIPLKEHVAGLSVGLISDIDPSTGAITEYRILTDILVRNTVVPHKYIFYKTIEDCPLLFMLLIVITFKIWNC